MESIKEKPGPSGAGHYLFHFMNTLIEEFAVKGRLRTSQTYMAALRSFSRFRNDRDIRLDRISSGHILQYEAYLRAAGLAWNSISFYMRILRAVYNRAVDRNLTVQRHPFRHVYTGIDKTAKRAISLVAVRAVKNLDLSSSPALDFARDIFLFSFYTRGMSFVDMAWLRKTDIRDGVLSYRRHKTGRLLCIRWETCMQAIVDKYDTADSEYLLPIIKAKDNPRRQYENSLHFVNVKLKEVARKAGIEVPLSTYVARHAWASIARSKNIPLHVISEGMGHSTEATTRIYLASLEASTVDSANMEILKDL